MNARDSLLWMAVLVALLCRVAAGPKDGMTVSEVEKELYDFLFSSTSDTLSSLPRCDDSGDELTVEQYLNSSKILRAKNRSSFDVRVEIFIAYLIGVDEKAQTTSLSIYFEANWRDCRLKWNTSEYPIEYLFLSTKSLEGEHIFMPSILLLEQIEPQFQLSENSYIWIEPNSITVRRAYSGKFMCDLDVTLYPFDTQSCSLTVTTVDDYLRDVNISEDERCKGSCNPTLLHVSNEVVMDTWEMFVPQPKWTKLNVRPCTEADLSNSTIDHDASCYAAHLVHTLILRRHPTFQFLNLFFPVAISVVLSSFVFLMPPGKGDKMELSLTILLSLFVYTQIVYQSMPDTGRTMPLISHYVMMCIFLVGFSCIVSVVGDMLDAQAVHVPAFLNQLLMVYVGPLILPSYFKKREKRRRTSQGRRNSSEEVDKGELFCLEATIATDLSENTEKNEDWRLLAAVFDRCFFYLHLSTSFVVLSVYVIYGYYYWSTYSGKMAET